jgi:hypothetical protein
MSTAASPDRHLAGAIGRHAPAAFFIAALVTAIPVWWIIATPVLSGAAEPFRRHLGHALWTYAHALTGTVMLFSGAAALWIGWTRKGFRLHRWVGGTYLVSGLLASGVVLGLNTIDVHHDIAVAAPMLGLAGAWLLAAAMAFRAIRNRRVDSHKQWVIRSYVLTWSFVFCRGLGVLPIDLAASAGPSLMWTTWIAPLLLCEALLQWRAGAAADRRR